MNADGQLMGNGVGEISACFLPNKILPYPPEDMAKARKTTVLILKIGVDARNELKREAVARGKTVSSIARERLTKKPDALREWKPKG